VLWQVLHPVLVTHVVEQEWLQPQLLHSRMAAACEAPIRTSSTNAKPTNRFLGMGILLLYLLIFVGCLKKVKTGSSPAERNVGIEGEASEEGRR
jgi:hypothetical protein